MKIILLSALVLAGCDSVISRTPVGEPEQREEQVSCRKFDFCITCMPGFDGKMTCAPKMSPYCPGNQKAIVQHQQVELLFESGKTQLIDQTNTIQTLEQCK